MILSGVYEWLFVSIGFMNWLNNAQHSPSQHWSYELYFYLESYLHATVYITMTFILRLILLILTMPLFALTFITGVVDGLVKRDIRRFGSGYESSFVYHHAKQALFPIFISVWIIYLSCPISIHPNLILVPSALVFGIAICLTTSMFKKYL